MPTTPPAPGSVTAFAPGRVNLIGEHTDYNDGLALPFATAQGVTVAARPGPEAGTIVARASDLDESDSFPIVAPDQAAGWRAYVRGVVAEMSADRLLVPDAELTISGDVPRGAGLSSSAALEVGLCLALLGLAGSETPPPVDLAQLCARVERAWAGAQSGLLDPLASLCGQPGHALLIDFRTLVLTPVAIDLGDWRLVVVPSGETHTLGSSGYNDRREECRRACVELGVASLRDATIDQAESLPEPLARRVRHVIGENERVLDAVACLQARDLPYLGELLNASHVSLRDDYAVSTDAVEAARDALLSAGAAGARIVGGGFGGSVLGLMPPDAAAPPDATEVHAGPGATFVD